MRINSSTTIAALLKHHPDALEAIVRLSPKFGKLRNPLLRKLLAGRTTIAMAGKIGGCAVTDFFAELKPLGFEAEGNLEEETEVRKLPPKWLQHSREQEMIIMDVRPLLNAGKDPLKPVFQALNQLSEGHVLKIINSFEPSPLIALVEKKGYLSYVEAEDSATVFTYFYKASNTDALGLEEVEEEGWEEEFDKARQIVEIDVRHLPMPQPMIAILEALEGISLGQALHVQHKKVPVFLLQELRERGFEYRMKEIADHDVQLLIFKS